MVIETEFESELNEFIVTFNKKGEIIGVDFANTEAIEDIAQIVINSVAANDFVRARRYLSSSLNTEILHNRLQRTWQQIQKENSLFERIVIRQRCDQSQVLIR